MRRATISLAALFCVATLGVSAMGADATWDGDTDVNWSTADNWGVAPTGSDRVIFPAALTPDLPTLDANASIQSLRFEKLDGGWTLGGTGQTLTINVLNSSGDPLHKLLVEDLATSGTTTIEATVNTGGFGNYRMVTNGGTLVFKSFNWANQSQDLEPTGPGKIVIEQFANASLGRMDLRPGDGTLELPNAVNNTGTVDHQGPRLILGDNLSLGTGNLMLRGSSTNAISATADLTMTNTILWQGMNLSNGERRLFTGDHSLTFTGAMVNAPSGRDIDIRSDIVAGKQLIFTGDLDITDRQYWVTGDGVTEFSGDLSGTDGNGRSRMGRGETGDGMLILSGTNTQTGTTSIGNGVIRFDSPAAMANSQVATSNEGVIGLTFDLTREASFAGNVDNTVKMSGGGFAAYGADRTVNFGGAGATQDLGGGSGFMGPIDEALVLGHPTADAMVTIVNPISLDTGTVGIREFMAKDGSADIDGAFDGDVTEDFGNSNDIGINKTGAGTLAFNGALSVADTVTVSEGRMLVNGDASLSVAAWTVASGATLGGTGTVGGATTVNGSLAPGTSAGELAFITDVTLDTGASLDIEIGGTGFDVLNVGGTLDLGSATLNVSLFGGYMPTGGESFDILDWVGLSGSFGTINLPDIVSLSWDQTNLLVDGTLSIVGGATVLLGDANNDGVVSADDFAAVQTNFGNTGEADGLLPGDANDDGVVSADDFAAIQTNFGNVLGASAEAGAVPEPATMALLALGGIAAIRRRHK